MINTYNPNDPKGSLHRWRADIKSKHFGDPPDDDNETPSEKLEKEAEGMALPAMVDWKEEIRRAKGFRAGNYSDQAKKYNAIKTTLGKIDEVVPEKVATSPVVRRVMDKLKEDPEKYLTKVVDMLPAEGFTFKNFVSSINSIKELKADLGVTTEELDKLMKDSDVGWGERLAITSLLYKGGKIKYKAGGKVFIRNPKKLKKEDSEKKKLRKKYGRKNVKVTKGRAPNPIKWKTHSNKSGSKKPKNVKPTDKGHVKKKYNREILSLRVGAKPKRTNKPMQNA